MTADIDRLAELAGAATPGYHDWVHAYRIYNLSDPDEAYLNAIDPATILALIDRLRAAEADAIAEGMQWQDPTEEDKQWWADRCAEFGDDPELDPIQGVWIAPGTRRGYGATKEQRAEPHWGSSAKEAFRWTWEAIYGRDAWEENPWVAVTEFERIDRCPKTP